MLTLDDYLLSCDGGGSGGRVGDGSNGGGGGGSNGGVGGGSCKWL